MKKYVKQTISGLVFAILVCVALVLPNDILKKNITSVAAEDIVVHYYWDGEDTPHLYYENVNGEGQQVISWPGIPMKETSDNWYSYTISDVESADIVFSIGDAYETATLNRSAGEWWFDQDTWYAKNPREEESTTKLAKDSSQKKTTTVATATKTGTTGEYSKEDVTYTKDDKEIVGYSEINNVEEYIETYVKKQDLAAAEDASITIHYYAANGEVPSIYYWNALPQDQETVWPGQPMTMESENWYQYTFTNADKINLLFTYGLNQTKDLTRKNGEWWYKNGRWYASKPKDSAGDSETPIASERGDFREETIYFLMTTRFYDGDPSNNVHCWDENALTPEEDPAWRGDFQGLIEKLDYIKALGFSAIWITPVVENASGLDYHGYHAMNFQKVDARYESEGVTYQTLINEVHKRGMKIVQDVVFNHTGNFGEANLAPMFEKDPTVEGGYGSIECMKFSEDSLLPENYNYFDTTKFKNESDFGGWQYQTRLALMKDTTDPVNEGTKNDPYSYYHHYGQFNWDFYSCQMAQIAGDCVDLNTENPLVAKYITDSYTKYIDMGVDAFRVDTVKHISRLTFNNFFNPVFKAAGGENFYMFGEVCARSSEVWYRGTTCALSSPFYTWKESKDYPWIYYSETVQGEYDASAGQTFDKKFSDFGSDVEYFAYRSEQEKDLAHETNLASTEQNYNDNANDVDEKVIDGRCTQKDQPVSTNAFLEGNEYHEPDRSEFSGLDVIDFQMHRNFNTAQAAFNVAIQNYDFENMKVKSDTVGGDYSYNDATWNVVYVDSHDYGPDKRDGYRYDGTTEDWAENMNLMFTFRGVPCLYYGSEVQFQAGVRIDDGPNLPLKDTGRAYFGDYLEGEVTASDFGVYDAEAGSAVEETLSKPLCQQLMRLNKIRRAVPALQKGQYSLAGIEFSDMAFKRRYTDDNTDSFVLVTITGEATFNDIPNGTYVDAITGDTQKVSNGTLAVDAPGKGNMRVYVLDTDLSPAPGKIGTDTTYLK